MLIYKHSLKELRPLNSCFTDAEPIGIFLERHNIRSIWILTIEDPLKDPLG